MVTTACIFGACTIETEVGWERPDTQTVAKIPSTFRDQLDLMIVVDDTAGMGKVQAELGAWWQRLRAHLEFAEGGFPDARIAIVSTDMGVGVDGLVPGCDAGGDGGAARRFADGRPWLELARTDPAAGDDELAAALVLGEDGCAFEQPLAAVRAAVSLDQIDPTWGRFDRDGAALGVVVVSGDDDCSLFDPQIFADGAAPLDKFRCFREGVRCGGDDVSAGAQHDCAPRDESPYLTKVGDHVELLAGLKDDRRAVAVATVLGDPEAVTVVEGKQGLSLSPACERAGELYPGIRLAAFADGLGGAVADLCDTAVTDAARPVAVALRRALGHRCLEGRVADLDPAPGMQVECVAFAVDERDGARTPLAACPNPARIWDERGPCYAIVDGGAPCGDFPTQLAAWVNWGPDHAPGTAPPHTATLVECLVEDDAGPADDPANAPI